MKPLYIAVMSNMDRKPSRLIIRDDPRELVHAIQERLAVRHSTEYPSMLAEYNKSNHYVCYDSLVEFIAKYI